MLLEELGHAIDRRLNGGTDSPGDEGQWFAERLLNGPLSAEQQALIGAEDDGTRFVIEGVTVAVEQAAPVITLPSNIRTNRLNYSLSLTNAGADLVVAIYDATTPTVLLAWQTVNRSTNFANP